MLYLIIIAAVGVGCVVYGVATLWGVHDGRSAVRAVRAWPTVSGTIERAWVDSAVATTLQGNTRRTHTPHRDYAYAVGGRTYRAERPDFAPPRVFGSLITAERFLARYPVGGAVTVRHDPASPGIAVLSVAVESDGGSTRIFLGLLGLVGGVGVLALLLAFA